MIDDTYIYSMIFHNHIYVRRCLLKNLSRLHTKLKTDKCWGGARNESSHMEIIFTVMF